ncbi:multicopper oxidase family protein [Dethiosulfatarculus sandiegensis]|nr:multicopper oxidase family protein [Dethiosulfatarculus sandiegensis]
MDRRRFLLSSGTLALACLLPVPSLAKSPVPNNLRSFDLTAGLASTNLGTDRTFRVWSYNQGIPGPVIRVRTDDVLKVNFRNKLPHPSTVHWHGLPVPNSMDGVPGVTQQAVLPGDSFTYEFPCKPSGTYIYHSHQGLQLDRGLYGALIVDDPNDSLTHDQDFVLVLEDWAMVDGGGPEAGKRKPAGRMMHGGRGMMRGPGGWSGSGPLSEPVYNAYAVNGRIYPHTKPVKLKKGEKVRLRVCNASSSTIYDLRLAGHSFTIVRTDGRPIKPVKAEVLRIGMGERYDLELVADNPGNWLLGAYESGWGESGLKLPFVYEGKEDIKPVAPSFRRGLAYPGYFDFQAAAPSTEAYQEPARWYRQVLSGGMHSPYWTINGRGYPDSEVLRADLGQVVRLAYINHSHMPHPMHLHGHFFKLVNPSLPPEKWISKDTLIVDPMQRLEVQFLADNPGDWFHHCHHLYHMEAGMANIVRVA